MVHQMLSDGNLKFAQLLRNSLVTKVGRHTYTNTRTHTLTIGRRTLYRQLVVTKWPEIKTASNCTVATCCNETYMGSTCDVPPLRAHQEQTEPLALLVHLEML